MKHLLALAALFLAGCTATIDKPRPAPTPAVVYVRDEAAIAEARTDGQVNGLLAGSVFMALVLGSGGIAAALTMRRNDQPQHQAQLPPVVHITNNYIDQRTVTVTPAMLAARRQIADAQGGK